MAADSVPSLGKRGARKASGPAFREIGEGELVLGRAEVGVEIVNSELVEVAEHDVAGPSAREAGPVIEGLPVVLLEVRAALLHLDEHDGFPDETAFEEKLVFAYLIAGAVLLAPSDEFREFDRARHGWRST